jgi:adenosylcobyric acid synthase
MSTRRPDVDRGEWRMKPHALMFQGTGSHVGKSVIVAGLCRALVRRGMKVAPFKPQNMSNNAAVAREGGEIGRAQALQARAARLAPSIHMNPVLLKPESEGGAQIVVQGKRFGTMRAAEYGQRKAELLAFVLDSFAQVSEGADIVLVEGAGSPAELNLRAGDIANMGFAEAANVPVILVGDIDRGGVIASLVGTHAVLDAQDRQRIQGFMVNKFRGDAGLFADGLRLIEERTGWPSLGVVPWLDALRLLPAEDSLGLQSGPQAGGIRIAVLALPRIANFEDLDPLRMETGVSVVVIQPGEVIPADASLVILPGSKSTIADLAFLRAQGWDIDILAHRRRGGRVLGLCGGYQMLGRTIADPEGIEGPPRTVAGLGLLDLDTTLSSDKTTSEVTGRHIASAKDVSGYEIHLGRSEGPDRSRPVFDLCSREDGATSPDGRVAGTYVHGIFASDGFRRAFLSELGAAPSELSYAAEIEAALDALADHLERHLDIDRLIALSGLQSQDRSASGRR